MVELNFPQAVSRRALCGTFVFAPLFGCAKNSQKKPESAASPQAEYRGPLVNPRDIPGDFMWQQRVTATHGESRGSFDAVVQKKGAELLVLGLTPMKTRGFSLTQRETDVEYKQFVPFELPFAPASVLYDIHRAFFYNLLGPFPTSGTRDSAFENERIKDEFVEGRLVARRFENVSDSGKELLIEYSPQGYVPKAPPEVTTIENLAYGYHLRVETTSAESL